MFAYRGLLKKHFQGVELSVRALDVLFIVAGGLLSLYLRFGSLHGQHPIHITLIVINALLALVLFQAAGLYRSWRGRPIIELLGAIVLAWLTTLTIGILLTYFIHQIMSVSRLWLSVWAVSTAMLMIALRLTFYQALRFIRERGYNQRRVLIVGAGKLGQSVAIRVKASSWTGYTVAAFYDDAEDICGTKIDNFPVICGIEAFTEFVCKKNIDEVWFALPLRAERRMQELMHAIRHELVNIRLIPDIFGFRLLNHSVSDLMGMPIIDLTSSPMSGINVLAKLLLDRAFAAITLIAISPLMLGIALAIKLTSPGPVLFKQKRLGWDGKVITIYKFRSMKVHQEAGKVSQATRNDPRITPIGAFLRRTSLDELPQFLNVLQGDMSVVGPRPHALEHNEIYKDLVDKYMLRHKVKPGITGWAQVNGYRGETDTLDKMEKRVEYDLYYIENWSLWLDIKIILATFFKGFISKNAY